MVRDGGGLVGVRIIIEIKISMQKCRSAAASDEALNFWPTRAHLQSVSRISIFFPRDANASWPKPWTMDGTNDPKYKGQYINGYVYEFVHVIQHQKCSRLSS